MESSAELTQGLQQVQVVGPHKVLGQVDDGAHQGGLKITTGTPVKDLQPMFNTAQQNYVSMLSKLSPQTWQQVTWVFYA